MKQIVLLALGLFFAITAFSQRPPYAGRGQQQGPSIKGKVTGTVYDSLSQQPIEFATIVLKTTGGEKEVNGGITDDKGQFKLQDIKNGQYELHLSFIGYRTKVVRDVELTLEKPDIGLGDIFMLSEGVVLNEVTVTEDRSLIENRIDKLVYNAEKDLTSIGGDATDLLRKVPLLTVDIDGNVSLRGSSNVRVLINGRPSSIFSDNVAEALKAIPADQIKNVEVITTPSAKYDGEGTAGIINIITKKKSVEGFTGSINTTIGTRINRGSVNLSHSSGRFGLNFSGNSYLTWPRDGFSEFYREDYQGDTLGILRQDADTENRSFGPGANLSAFYDINAYNSLNSSLSFRGRGGTDEGTTEATYEVAMRDIFQQYTRLNDSRSFRGGFDWNTDYRRTFKTPEQEFVLAFQVAGANSYQRNTIRQNGNGPSLEFNERNSNDGLNLEYTVQADYTHPFSNEVKLEASAKGLLRRIDSDYDYENFDFESQQYLLDNSRSDIFYYDQDVLAGYMSFNIKLGEKYGGGQRRYEYTQIAGDFATDANTFANSYGNLLPSIILNRQLKNFSNLKASYTRRIQRPSLFFVNPYVDLSDPRNISFGNPELSPELTSQFELSYGAFVKGFNFNAAAYYRYTDDVIQSFLLGINEDGASETTYLNIGKNDSYGVNLFTSVTIAKKVTLRGGANIYMFNTESRRADLELRNEALLFSGNIGGSVDFGKGYKWEMFGFYSAPRQTLQGRNASFSLFSMTFLKEFGERASLGLNIIEPFFKFKEFPSVLEDGRFYQRINRGTLFRSFGLNFNYRFGKLDFRQQRRRSKIDNDDLKDGGSGEF